MPKTTATPLALDLERIEKAVIGQAADDVAGRLLDEVEDLEERAEKIVAQLAADHELCGDVVSQVLVAAYHAALRKAVIHGEPEPEWLQELDCIDSGSPLDFGGEQNTSCGCHPEYEHYSVKLPWRIVAAELAGKDWRSTEEEAVAKQRETEQRRLEGLRLSAARDLAKRRESRDRAELKRLKAIYEASGA